MLAESIKVPVRYGGWWEGLPQPISVQIGYFEDGEFVLEECNHAGAEEEPSVGYSFWADAAINVPDADGPMVLVCDKKNCKAVYNGDGTWGA